MGFPDFPDSGLSTFDSGLVFRTRTNRGLAWQNLPKLNLSLMSGRLFPSEQFFGRAADFSLFAVLACEGAPDESVAAEGKHKQRRYHRQELPAKAIDQKDDSTYGRNDKNQKIRQHGKPRNILTREFLRITLAAQQKT